MGNALPHLIASPISPCQPQPVEFNSTEFAADHMVQIRFKQKKSVRGASPEKGSTKSTVSTVTTDGYRYSFSQPTALGSVQNVVFENDCEGLRSTDLIQRFQTDQTSEHNDRTECTANKGWSSSVVEQRDAFYYDQSTAEDIFEDMLFKLSMEDALRIHGKAEAETDREGPTTDAVLGDLEPQFSSDSASSPCHQSDDSYSVIYEESRSLSPTPSLSSRLAKDAHIWTCEECGFLNNYASGHCASCYQPTPKKVMENQSESKTYFKY